MANYDAWNRAISQHFTAGVPLGNAIYLSVDEDVIAQIAATPDALPVQPVDALADYLAAVRGRVVLEGRRMGLRTIASRDPDNVPSCVAFLALMVMAAGDMAGEVQEDRGHIDEKDYFRRLRKLLGLEAIGGRPEGMKSGAEAEEPLWLLWNRWLGSVGFVSTARRRAETTRYIDYPISQTLLRKADKDRIRGLFSRAASRWQADIDGETLLVQLRTDTKLNSRYLLDTLSHPGTRYQALSDTLYDLHEIWRADPDVNSGVRGIANTNRTLRCGLFREYDQIMGTIDYRLYPRTPAGRRDLGGVIEQDGQSYPLEVERQGWFAALDPLSPHEVSSGSRFPVGGLNGITEAVLPKRSFWVLVPDPQEPESGVYASWRHPTLGEPAIVLIADDTLPLLRQLRDEGLVQWDGEPFPVASLGGWSEVRDCLVVSEALGGVFGDAQAIFEELRPATRLGISTRGGLRSPDRQGWIAGLGPEITVTGFDSEVEMQITRATGDGEDRIVVQRTIPCLTPLTFANEAPGIYRIDATAGGHEAAPRLVRIVAWDELATAMALDYSTVAVGNWQIIGATLRPSVTRTEVR